MGELFLVIMVGFVIGALALLGLVVHYIHKANKETSE